MERHPDATGAWWYFATIVNTGTRLDGLEVPIVPVKQGLDFAWKLWRIYEDRVRYVTGQQREETT